jgi:hypothetical protein
MLATCDPNGTHWRQAPEVHADTNRHLTSLGLRYDLPHAVSVTDVPWVKSKTVDALVEGFERELIVEVNVGDKGDMDLPLNLTQGFGGLHVGHSATYDLATHVLKLMDLTNCCGDVARVSLGHGLDGDGSVAAHFYPANKNGLGHSALHHIPVSTTALVEEPEPSDEPLNIVESD